MKVTVLFDEPNEGKFSKIWLCYTDLDSIERKVGLDFLRFEGIHDYTQDFSSIRFDFFMIASIIYGTDNLFSRERYSYDGWSRELEIDLPVVNIAKWKGTEEQLKKVLDFLTGDDWTINYVLNSTDTFFKPRSNRRKKATFGKQTIKKVSLFSGGLDSLIGVINELQKLGFNEKIMLVSHFDYKSVGPNSDQQKLYRYLIEKFPRKIYWIQARLALERRDQNHQKISIESNYRSRSLFFIGFGLYLSPIDTLIIPENGTISINYPLTPSRVSSLSTRTTHPFVLKQVRILLEQVGLEIKLENPYSFMTKGEMVEKCSNQDFLKAVFRSSISCGKRGRKQHWDTKTGTEQCGRCMPCIYRRAALNKVNLDNELFGIDVLKQSELTNDLPALFNYLKRNISLEEMKRDILVNGNIDVNDLEKYAKMVLRSKKEVLRLFKNKGNTFVKSKLK